MVDYIYWLGAERKRHGGLSQIREAPLKIDYTAMVNPDPEPRFLSAIPHFQPLASADNKASMDTRPLKRQTIQATVYGAVSSAVHWWRDPLVLYTWALNLIPASQSFDASDMTSTIIPQITSGSLIKYPTDAIPIISELREAMETPVEARIQAHRTARVYSGSPIRSEVEKDQGLAVLLTDEFRPLAYI